MTQTASTPQALATALLQAYDSQRPIDPADWSAIATAEDAYAVQAQVDQVRHSDAGPRYWKSGGASRAAVLTHAPLPGIGIRTSPANLSDLHFFAPGIEAEVALRLKQSVTPAQAAALTPETAGALIDAMAVTIEVVDSRWGSGNVTPMLKLADFQAHGALIVGEWQAYEQRDWAAQRCQVQIGSAALVERTGTHALGDPSWLLPTWLHHATRQGQTVPAHTVVTTGTWVGILPVQRGDLVIATFPGIGEAQVVV